ncbi:unnamed protein product [Toxocara canis]|uniref:Lysosomal cystine transporter n=1 Tax=Toxocara canis TaxID=6265 RepID=A0A183TYV6_TOXCA|nr:unnamed protein product [Toxocara canis]
MLRVLRFRYTTVSRQSTIFDSLIESLFASGDFTEGLFYMTQIYGQVLQGYRVDTNAKNGSRLPIPIWALIVISISASLFLIMLVSLIIYYCCIRKSQKYTLGRRV